MGHSLYNPDLAPNNFFLFPNIPNKMRGTRFLAVEEAVDALKNYVFEVSQAAWEKCNNNLFKRTKNCIVTKDKYFVKEKVIKKKLLCFNHKAKNINSDPYGTQCCS